MKTKRRIGVIGAMPQEVSLMARSMRIDRTTEVGMRTFYEGSWGGQDVVLVLSRVGKVSAAATTLMLIERFHVTHIIFTGVAGAVDHTLRVGDIVIANRLVQHDMDASPLPAFERFEIPLLDKIFFETDPQFLELAEKAAKKYSTGEFLSTVPAACRETFSIGSPGVYRGLVASGDQFLAAAEKVAELRTALPGLLCAEMEGAAVAQICYEMGGLPVTVIRIISDRADHSAAVDFLQFIEEIAEHLTGGIVRTLLESLPE